MAELDEAELVFGLGCPDCGERRAELPLPLPGVADDFDWRVRDYDSFRLFMMQELAHRFPDRRRWTPADMEVVIVELLAAALDRASHALDVTQGERYLDSARRPQSVRRLLKLIGYDAVERVDPDILRRLPPRSQDAASETDAEKIERYWQLYPAAMEAARLEGPRVINEQRRMVTLADHQSLLSTHPLVARAKARLVWSGAWSTILLAAMLEIDIGLDQPLHLGAAGADRPDQVNQLLWAEIVDFHRQQHLALPPVDDKLTVRRLLRVVVERYRMVGTEVFLEEAVAAPVKFTLSVRARKGYFRSEVKQALDEVFTADQGGFFELGRLAFGENLYASDIIEAAMTVEGVQVACLNRFKRVGPYPDRTVAGFIDIGEYEFAQCLNKPADPGAGTYRIVVNGGELA